MDSTDIILRVMILAMIGWVASAYGIARSRLPSRWRRRLIIPLWFLWMVFALGAPISTGRLSLADGVGTGASFTAGMMFYLFFVSLADSKRTR